MRKLEKKLSREDYDMVEEVCDLLAVSQDIQNREYFKYGFSLGLQLMREAEAFEVPGLEEKSRWNREDSSISES